MCSERVVLEQCLHIENQYPVVRCISQVAQQLGLCDHFLWHEDLKLKSSKDGYLGGQHVDHP